MRQRPMVVLAALLSLLNGCTSEPLQIQTFKDKADHGDAGAQQLLGDIYERNNVSAFIMGLNVPQNYAEAMKWYRKAADQGYAEAQMALGRMYRSGSGTPQDYAEAIKWYRKAAAQENDDARKVRYTLGQIDEGGKGAPQDYVQAYAWYSLASAMLSQHAIASKMTPAQIAEAEKLIKEWRRTTPGQ